MAIITWGEDFSVGVHELDEQHKELILIINELFALYAAKKFKNTDVTPIFQSLKKYSDAHLSTEEHYFILYNYPKLVQHVEQHNLYRKKLAELEANYNTENSEKTLFALNDFLNEWWTWHINHVDKEYTEYFHANGLK
ncbi:MAG: bacteriohemerythrin [Candidatus Falkowbacteria bacterium]